LPVIAYEAGWALGGDFNTKPIQIWSKFKEDKATSINDTAEDIFQRSGSFMNVWGVYIYWPEHDVINAAAYPLMRSIAGIAARPRAEADNGIALPCKLTSTNSILGKSIFSKRGEWQSWLGLVPATGTWNFTVQARGDSPWELEIDGIRVAGGPEASSASGVPCAIRMVKGQHGIRLRAGGPLTLESISVEKR
jgi:hypothetical protein